MKLSILLAGSILTSAIVGNAYAQTCGAQPSCAELGYTLTSTSSCVGNVLKCPFDKTKYYCTQKSEVFSNMKLDWNRKVSVSYNTTYYVKNYGCLWGNILDIGDGTSYYSVNGTKIRASMQGDDSALIFTCLAPGDYITATVGKTGDNKLYFVPFAGN
ncbi:MAG: hypothetical protein ACLSWJ_05465 [Alphaproteobacteria bacterium]